MEVFGFIVILAFFILLYHSITLESEAKRQRELKLRQARESEAKRQREFKLRQTREAEVKQQREREFKQKREAEAKRQREFKLRQTREAEVKQQREREVETKDRKANWQKFQNIIELKDIDTLYHFTDRSNLKSIKENGGLFSWYYCKENKINILTPGGDDLSRRLDIRYDLEDYVRLSFTQNHPMMYVAMNNGRINNPVILKISPEVILWRKTRYSDMNATKTGHSEGESIRDFLNIRFDIVNQRNHFDLSNDEKKYYQAEVMVKSFIPLKFIKNINQF